jgi:hypothetical protein
MNGAHPEGRYEHTDAQARPLLLAGLVLALLLLAAMAVSVWLSETLTAQTLEGERRSPVEHLRVAPETPELQAIPAQELERHRAWEERTLASTEWIDSASGIVRIPIERALELVLAEGLPARPAEAKK